MFSLLALDFDGVILDSVAVKAEAFRRVCAPYGPELTDRLLRYHRLEGGVNREVKLRWMFREAHGRECTDGELRALWAQFVEHMEAALWQCPFLPGFEDLLAAWRGRVPICVCSGAPQQELIDLLAARGKAGYFTSIRGYPPAKEELLADILHEADASPQRCVMVGDSFTDSRAAEVNGTLFYGIGELFAGSAYPHGRDLRDCNLWLREAHPERICSTGS
jgi:beta-phosphoglucomutase-like phosphatase (HAD superfamily)